MNHNDQPAPASASHPTLAIFGPEHHPVPRTLADIARATIQRHPEAVAIDCEGNQLTYAEFSVIVDEQVERLRLCGIGRGDRVGIYVPPGSMQLYVTVLAVVFAGATHVPVDWEESEDRAQAVWEAADVHVVYGADLQLTVRRPMSGPPDVSPPGPDDDTWIRVTGPTDALQLVSTTHRSAVAIAQTQARAYLQEAPLGPGDRVMTRQVITSLAAAKEVWLSWYAGATLVPVPCAVYNSHQKLIAWIVEQEITVIAATPDMATAWPRQTLDKVRLLILIGQDAPRDVLERLRRPGMEIWTGYRDTFTAARLYDGEILCTLPGNVGGPLPGMGLAVVDGHGQPVRWGKTGEIVVTGPALDPHLGLAEEAGKCRPLPALGWERALHTGTQVRAEPDGL